MQECDPTVEIKTQSHVQLPGFLSGAAPSLFSCSPAQSLGSCCCAQCFSTPGTFESIVLIARLTRCARHLPEA